MFSYLLDAIVLILALLLASKKVTMQAIFAPLLSLFGQSANSTTRPQPYIGPTGHEIPNDTEVILDDDIAERVFDRLIKKIIDGLGPRATDAFLDLELRDGTIAKAERDANRSKPMKCFINIGDVFTFLCGYVHIRDYPRHNWDGCARLNIFNPFCSFDPEEPRFSLTDPHAEFHEMILDQRIQDSLSTMLPTVRASFECLKAGMSETPTAALSNDRDPFNILDRLNGVQEAYNSYQYFDPANPTTLSQFIDQLAISEVVWSLAQLLGPQAVNALDRLQEKQGKYLLRYSPTPITCAVEFDLTDPEDDKAHAIKENFAEIITYIQ